MTDPIPPPRLSWPLMLGAVGLIAGFLGPIVFTPESNQGPLVGLLFSGPAGVLLGFALRALCNALKLSGRIQWGMLMLTAVIGGIAVLVLVQPPPALRGYVMDLKVTSCAPVRDRDEQILDDWSKRLTDLKGVTPRTDWQEDVRRTLRDAPGSIIDVDVKKQISVWENRKPWNHGSLFAVAGRNAPQEHAFYVADRSCAELSADPELRAFEKYDLNGRIEPYSEWPPRRLEQLVGVSPVVPVPPTYEHLE